MDSDGLIVDKAHVPVDVGDKEVLTWYRNMLTGTSFSGRQMFHIRERHIQEQVLMRHPSITVSIMDVIMFEAQRQGRLSFYMVDI